jgi:hypothetical protein
MDKLSSSSLLDIIETQRILAKFLLLLLLLLLVFNQISIIFCPQLCFIICMTKCCIFVYSTSYNNRCLTQTIHFMQMLSMCFRDTVSVISSVYSWMIFILISDWHHFVNMDRLYHRRHHYQHHREQLAIAYRLIPNGQQHHRQFHLYHIHRHPSNGNNNQMLCME